MTTKHTGELDGVSCPATGNCTAVGWNDAGKALAAHWNGKAWSDESPANPQPLTYLENVSCPATTTCIAVGTAGTFRIRRWLTAPLAEQWTGGTGRLSPSLTRLLRRSRGTQRGVVHLGHELHGRG